MAQSGKKELVLIARAATLQEFVSLRDVADVKETVVSDGDLGKIPDEDCAHAVVVVVGHLEVVDRAFLARCPRLRTVVRCGMGYELIDVKAAGEAGVLVCNSPDYGIEEVADTAFTSILCLFRQTTFLERYLREGAPLSDDQQLASAAPGARRLRGSTLGLLGLGKIGMAVTQRAKAFGMRVAFYDPFTPPGLGKALGGVEQFSSLEEMVRASDCVSLHCPLTPENRHIVNGALLQQFKSTAFLVNTSRGGLVDEGALATALKEGKLAGAALDVFEKEPFVLQGSVFEGVPNLILTPHSAWFSQQSVEDIFSGCRNCARTTLETNEPAQVPVCVNFRQLNMDACKSRWNKNI